MVSIKQKNNIRLQRQLKDVKKQFAGAAKRAVVNEIRKSILRGVTPVKGVTPRRFEKYSDSYKDAIESGQVVGKSRVRPVNLKVTGKLLRDLKSKRKGTKIIVFFDNVLADIHNRLGAGKAKTIRRILPTKEGEELSTNIMKNLRRILVKTVRKILR